jgi:hypothetical protein
MEASHVEVDLLLLEGSRELGGVHTPLVVAQGALGQAGPARDPALGDLMVHQDGHDRGGIAPLARLIEVLTCGNGSQLLADDMLCFGHGARPVPMGRPARITGDAASQSHVAITRCNSLGGQSWKHSGSY